MKLERLSPCKVNLVLNILGKRPDGFHELETLMQPVNVCDILTFVKQPGTDITLTCSEPSLPVDGTNLVVRAARSFFETCGISDGVRIHLEKRIPLAAGLGGGSGNAANTLLGLNQLFDGPLSPDDLWKIAASLGSDVPFFLQSKPALAVGRGEQVSALDPFPALAGRAIFLIHPGFGISTAWAYQNLARFPTALAGKPGLAAKAASLLSADDMTGAASLFYNSLEAPALEKYPILSIFQEYLKACGANVALMSGSGSTTFAIFENLAAAEAVVPEFKARFGAECWASVVPMD